MTLITLKEAAKIVDINPLTLKGRINRGIDGNFPFPVAKTQQAYLYKESEVLAFYIANQVVIPKRVVTSKEQPNYFIYEGVKLQILMFLQGEKKTRHYTARLAEMADSKSLYKRYAP
jgi:hypothetical protein